MFRSFFMAGFECATGYNQHREWFDQIEATQHEEFVDEDYARLRSVGISTAREGVRWPLVDKHGGYDFSSVRPLLEASRKHNIEIIYDLFHFGYPNEVDLFSSSLPERFAEYCYAVARYISANTEGVCYFTPINEPSYFSWAAGEAGFFAPHTTGRGWELKVCLIRAAIRGIEAIRAACPDARIVNVDSLCRVVEPLERPELRVEADAFNYGAVYQSWDMLCGRLLPELGGSKQHLDMLGINYYWTNQWELNGTGCPLDDCDPRRLPLRTLVHEVWGRYGAEMVLTETSHVGDMRPVWVRELTGEIEALLSEGMPLRGVCLYPILGMPEWHARHEWTRMGLWDLESDGHKLQRTPCMPMLDALRDAQSRLARKEESSMLKYTIA